VKALIRVVAQRHESDCGVACLAMFLGVSYEDALIAIGSEAPSVLKRGVWWTHLKRAAETLGTRMVVKRKWSETDEGLLQVKYRKGYHVVVLRHGLIFDTDQRIWTFDDFKHAPPKAPFGPLLVREETE